MAIECGALRYSRSEERRVFRSPCGYHRLSVEPGRSTMTVAITPGYCWLPSALVDGDRMWGIAVQQIGRASCLPISLRVSPAFGRTGPLHYDRGDHARILLAAFGARRWR